MGVSVRALVAACVVAPLGAGCSFLSWSSLTAGDAGDASVDVAPDTSLDARDVALGADVTDVSDVDSDVPDGPKNWIPDPSFEGSSLACAGWNVIGATATISASDAYMGKKGCRVCVSGSGNGGFDLDVTLPVAQGANLTWSGMVHSETTGGPSTLPGAEIDLSSAVGDAGVYSQFTTAIFLGVVWGPFQVTVASAPRAFDRATLRVAVHSVDGTLACVVFDDMSLVMSP